MTANSLRVAASLVVLLVTGALRTSDASAAEVVRDIRVVADPACVSRLVQLPLRWQNASAPRFNWCKASAYGATPSEQATRRAVMQACC